MDIDRLFVQQLETHSRLVYIAPLHCESYDKPPLTAEQNQHFSKSVNTMSARHVF